MARSRLKGEHVSIRGGQSIGRKGVYCKGLSTGLYGGKCCVGVVRRVSIGCDAVDVDRIWCAATAAVPNQVIIIVASDKVQITDVLIGIR